MYQVFNFMPQDNIQKNTKEDVLNKDTDTSSTETDKFDEAFTNSSPVIQDYILSNKFEENIKLISQIVKMDNEKTNTIIENVAVSILVNLLPLERADIVLSESFKMADIAVEKESIENILKNINTYILSNIQKKISQERIENHKSEIKHLTLKEKNFEKEKEELRKILLERTGVLTGTGETLIQYKNRDEISQEKLEKEEKAKEVKSLKDTIVNRESLLAKVNIKNLDDADKIKERMLQIKMEEDSRLAKLQEEEKAKEALRQKRKELEEKRKIELESFNKENEIASIEIKAKEEESEDLSKLLAHELMEKIGNKANEDVDLNVLREKRAQEEKNMQKNSSSAYSREMSTNKDITDATLETFDPYREDL